MQSLACIIHKVRFVFSVERLYWRVLKRCFCGAVWVVNDRLLLTLSIWFCLVFKYALLCEFITAPWLSYYT